MKYNYTKKKCAEFIDLLHPMILSTLISLEKFDIKVKRAKLNLSIF